MEQQIENQLAVTMSESESVRVDPVIVTAFEKFKGSTDISIVNFGRDVLGFDEKTLEFAKIFQTHKFNESWLYLSDDLIANYLTDERSKHTTKHYVNQVLKPNYNKDVDYIEVEFNHPCVQAYFRWLNLATNHVNGKKYYLVSGECYKHMLMTSNM
jgi:hypothetical protein